MKLSLFLILSCLSGPLFGMEQSPSLESMAVVPSSSSSSVRLSDATIGHRRFLSSSQEAGSALSNPQVMISMAALRQLQDQAQRNMSPQRERNTGHVTQSEPVLTHSDVNPWEARIVSGSRIDPKDKAAADTSVATLHEIPHLDITSVTNKDGYTETHILLAGLNAWGDKKAEQAEKSKLQRNVAIFVSILGGIGTVLGGISGFVPTIIAIIQGTSDGSSGGSANNGNCFCPNNTVSCPFNGTGS